jgi:hypothetical protein
MAIRDWTSETWTAIVAVVALIQPWLLHMYRRLFRRGSIDIYEIGGVEIGFSGFGPTIGLMGTLRSRDQDMFVQSANISLIRVGEATCHSFQWGAFRTPKTVVTSNLSQSAEVGVSDANPVMVRTAQPYHYNVLFLDLEVFPQVRATLESFKQTWINFIDEKGSVEINAPLDASMQKRLIQQLRPLHKKFAATDKYQKGLKTLEDLFYWEAATYSLTLRIQAARPNRTFAKTWKITLQETDVENLRNNIPSIFEETAGVPISNGIYLFAYPSYQSSP